MREGFSHGWVVDSCSLDSVGEVDDRGKNAFASAPARHVGVMGEPCDLCGIARLRAANDAEMVGAVAEWGVT